MGVLMRCLYIWGIYEIYSEGYILTAYTSAGKNINILNISKQSVHKPHFCVRQCFKIAIVKKRGKSTKNKSRPCAKFQSNINIKLQWKMAFQDTMEGCTLATSTKFIMQKNDKINLRLITKAGAQR